MLRVFFAGTIGSTADRYHYFSIITEIRVMRSIGLIAFLLTVTICQAQYWIGPKVGYHYTVHDYQDDLYLDNYKNSNDHNYEIGLVVTYTASDRYAVHGELFYEQIGNRVKSLEDNFFVDSRSTYRFLSFPILWRVSMGHSPVHWYLNAGPKVSLWMGGKGNIEYTNDGSQSLDGIERVDYNVVFIRRNASGIENGKYFVNESNRLQYALTVGGGFYLDLANGARLMIDARYNWGHSNMGFNVDTRKADGRTILVGNNTDIPFAGYQENYEYSHTSMSFSIAYMFEYNTELKRKGGSTSSESKRTKKSAKAKKKSAQ